MNKKTKNIPTVGLAHGEEYVPSEDEIIQFENFEKQAESDIQKLKQNSTFNFRWSEFEIKRAKKIAAKMGLPYQTYIKMTLKQAMDNDEKKLN